MNFLTAVNDHTIHTNSPVAVFDDRVAEPLAIDVDAFEETDFGIGHFDPL